MKHHLLFMAAACLLATLSSCESKDYDSYPPTWKGFRFTKDNAEVNANTGIFAGDVITVTALQDQKGRLINATTYNWDVIAPVQQEDGKYVNDTIYSKSIHTNYDGLDSGDPSVTFSIPEKALGQSTVVFSASYSFSGYGIQVADGSSYENSGSVSGYITSTSADMFGGAKGSVRFKINSK